MAHSVDSFNDLEELGINCNGEGDDLTDLFNEAANHLQKLLPNVDNQTLLTLYGYYKQATEGECKIPKPSWYDMKNKSKWEAWNKLENMPQNEAKHLYIETINKLDPNFETGDVSSGKESWIKVSVLQSGEKIEEYDKNLVDFIKDGNYEKVEEILNNVSTNTLNDLDKEGLALSHWCADAGYKNILKLLISKGADVNKQDADGQTPLHYASSCGHIDCIKLLLANGGKADIVDNDDCTPLSVACNDEVKNVFCT